MVRQLLVSAALMIMSTTAHSAPILWSLENVRFEDGGSATGSFLYDAELGILSDINITTTPGSLFSGERYSFLIREFGPGAGFEFGSSDQADLSGTSGLGLLFDDVLQSSGGTIGILAESVSQEFTCLFENCDVPMTIRSIAPGASITSAPAVQPVPVPAGILLLLTAVAGFYCAGSRKVS